MRRSPVGLTVCAALALVVLVGLGVWQLRRLKWKEGLIARIAALQHAPAQPIGPVLARGSRGADVEFARVTTACAPPPAPSPMVFRYSLRRGRVGWRLMTLCHLHGAPFDAILLDRGLVDRFAGAMAPGPARFAEPGVVTGVLRPLGGGPTLGGKDISRSGAVTTLMAVDPAGLAAVAARSGASHPAPWLLAVESESPVLAGVHPAPLPETLPNNHLAYALTWFGLAAALVWIYLGYLMRRRF